MTTDALYPTRAAAAERALVIRTKLRSRHLVLGALRLSLLPAMITVMLTDLFDSLSTFIGVAQAANLVGAHGEPKNLRMRNGKIIRGLSARRNQ